MSREPASESQELNEQPARVVIRVEAGDKWGREPPQRLSQVSMRRAPAVAVSGQILRASNQTSVRDRLLLP